MTKKILYTMDILSQEFIEEEITIFKNGKFIIKFLYFRNGIKLKSGISFRGVRSFSFTSEKLMSLFQINDSYDSVVEVSDSDLLNQINNTISKQNLNYPNPFHHYMIRFDSTGCYEIVAEDWELLPEEKIE